jgi:alpha-beta hydrolase superfamily lysophospholipase
MKESCCQFGPERRLAGILTEPSGRAPRVGLVLVSAGLLPKFGPYRLYTQLARRLARDGVVSLRFDLGGIGDSVQEASERPLAARTEFEIRAALDHLMERYELRQVVLGGLCSGAEDSFRAAASDPRVTGVLLIDPFAYRTSGWAWRHVVHRLARRTLRALGLYQPIASPKARGAPAPIVKYKYMEPAESTRILRALLDRNARVHFVYTAGMREVFNHERQLQALFPELDFRDLVTLDYLPGIDHTQLLEADRQLLLEAVARRLREQSQRT